jgi:hypothetical protein
MLHRGLLGIGVLCLAFSAVAADRDVMLVVDNSGSMRKNDPARVMGPAMQQFIERQPAGTRIGVVLFAENPRLVLPLTAVEPANRGALLSSLDGLDYTGRWTQTAGAVERGLYELRVNGRAQAEHALVLMTDGIIDTGAPERDRELQTWLSESLTEQARRDGVRIFGLAFTEQADYLLLQSLAVRTDAEYFRAPTPADIGPVLARIEAVMQRPTTAAAPVERVVPAPSVSRSAAAPVEPAADTTVASGSAPPAATSSGFWRVLGWTLAIMVLLVAATFAWRSRARLNGLLARFKPKERAPAQPRAVLYDVYDPSDIRRHEIGERPVVLGRVSGSDPAMDYVVVDERTVGRWHATIERRGQGFWIRDEGSVNGTFVNDQRITGEHPLKHGDMVRVHRHEFEFVIPDLFDSDRTMMAAAAPPKRERAAAEAHP